MFNPTPLYTPPRLPKFRHTKPGEIGPGRSWICVHDCYLYMSDSLLSLIWIVLTEWKNDKHLV